MFSITQRYLQTRRRRVSSSFSDSLNRLESRHLLSGATAPMPAEVAVVEQQQTPVSVSSSDTVSPVAVPPEDFAGTWEINGDSELVLTLGQTGNKVNGTFVGTFEMFEYANYTVKGKVKGDGMKLVAKGTYNGLKSKIKANVSLTDPSEFSGTFTVHTKNSPTESGPFAGTKV